MRIVKAVSFLAIFALPALSHAVIGYFSLPCPALIEFKNSEVKHMLWLALQDKPTVNVTAEICMKEHGHDLRKAIVTLNTAGFERIEVLSKDNRQGKVIVDNFDTRTSYDPVHNKMSVGKSPRGHGQTALRLKLIAKNYNVSMQRVTLLSRPIDKILAEPKSGYFPSVAIYVDPRSGFILETIRKYPDGHESASYRTCSLEYPKDLPSVTFNVVSSGPITTEQEPSPRFVNSFTDARKQLPFRPIIVKKLPYGFAVQRIFLLGRKHVHGLGIQISNGLAEATIFEFSAKNPPKWIEEDGSAKDGSVLFKGAVIFKVFSFESNKLIKNLLKSL